MALELTLLENVSHLGAIGEVVRVADGYARNYLLPRGLAIQATPGVLRQLEAKKRSYQEACDKELEDCTALAAKIADSSVTIPMQAGDDEKLYGSVTAQQIVDGLAEMEIEVERKQIVLAEPIRKLGVYSVDIYLHLEVSATLKVWVVRA